MIIKWKVFFVRVCVFVCKRPFFYEWTNTYFIAAYGWEFYALSIVHKDQIINALIVLYMSGILCYIFDGLYILILYMSIQFHPHTFHKPHKFSQQFTYKLIHGHLVFGVVIFLPIHIAYLNVVKYWFRNSVFHVKYRICLEI